MGGSRKRRHSQSEEEIDDEGVLDSDVEEGDQEEGELSDDSDAVTKKESYRKKSSHDHKKSKKKKKDKKKKKKRRRRSSAGSESPTSSSRGRTKGFLVAGEYDDDEASTDREGGSTPEVAPINVDASDDGEDGEVYDSEQERERRHGRHDRKRKRQSRHRHRRESYSPSENSRHERRSKLKESRSPSELRLDDRRSKLRGSHSPSESRRDDRRSRRSLSQTVRDDRRSKRKESRSPIESEEEMFQELPEDVPVPRREPYRDMSRDERYREKPRDSEKGREERYPEKSREDRSQRTRAKSPSVPKEESKSGDGAQFQQGNSSASISIEETNKLRASLGLKPLNIGGGQAKQDTQDDGEKNNLEGLPIPNSDVRHKPAENLAEKSHIEKMREKLNMKRQKRLVEAKLLNVKTLGDSDSDDDSAAAWVKKQAKKVKEKAAAEKRAKVLAELDDEFGVGNIVEEESKKEVAKAYGKSDLKGLRVEHSSEKFRTGQAIILTLKDSGVLDEEADDTLVNVNIMDEERVERNLKNLRDIKAGGYNPYEEEIDPLTGDLSKKGLLSKYDEEISGKTVKKSFEIGAEGQYDEDEAIRQERERIRQKLNRKMVESLDMPAPRIASDFLTAEESAVKFKKMKKKKKVKRKMLKADDLLGVGDVEDDDDMHVDGDVEPVETKSVKADDEDDIALRRALTRAKLLKRRAVEEDAGARIMAQINETSPTDEESVNGTTGAEFIGTFADDISSNKNIILNETSEFCRHLGAWRANEVTGMGESVSKDILDFESSLKNRSEMPAQQRRGRWEEVNNDFSDSDEEMTSSAHAEKKKNIAQSSSTTILDEEPNLARGVMGAIKLASTKGYFDAKEKEHKGTNLAHLMSKNYTIDDKQKDDDRNSRRERYGGPTQSFVEKSGYVPNVQLEYVDENGRNMNQKEAFRHLSHRFHGKGSGKLKTEKRMKKVMEESMMRNMSSTDTPLQTLEKLRERQKESATPYIVLTGNKINPTDLRK